MLVLAAAPLPFGGVYADSWVIWGIACGALGSATLWRATQREALAQTSGVIVLAAALWVTLLAYLAVQSLPLVPWGKDAIAAAEIEGQLSVTPLFSAMMLLRQTTYFTIAASLFWLAQHERTRRALLLALLASGMAYAIYGLIALQTGDTILGMAKWTYQGSATGPFVNRNSFATYLASTAMICLGLVASIVVQGSRAAETRTRRDSGTTALVLTTSYFFLLVTIVATQSRMGLLACLCGSGAIAVAAILITRRLQHALIFGTAALAAFAAAIYLVGAGLLTRIESFGFSFGERLELYRQVLQMIGQRLWTGWGGGSFEVAFRTVQSDELTSTLLWDRAHNSYLSLWSELGVVFGSIPIVLVAIVCMMILRRLAGAQRSLPALLTGLGAITVSAVHSLVDFSLEIPAIAMQFTAILAIAAGAAATLGREGRPGRGSKTA